MNKPILLDSGFLYALFESKDRFHEAVYTIIDAYNFIPVVPEITLGEATFLARRAGGITGTIRMLESLEKAGFQLEPLQPADIRRARELLTRYADIELDFVDSCVIAIAERLNIQHIGTIDQRDFRIVRPHHCEYFQLLPAIG
jgi:predicted nucleic acid-binding protein